MKIADEIIELMVEEMPYRFFESTKPYIKEAMQIYAQQACEDLRERITEQAKVKTVATPLGDYHEVNKESILNTEIILP